MLHEALMGTVAGATAAWVAVLSVTYTTMTIRGSHPPSSVPKPVVGKFAGKVGIDLFGEVSEEGNLPWRKLSG